MATPLLPGRCFLGLGSLSLLVLTSVWRCGLPGRIGLASSYTGDQYSSSFHVLRPIISSYSFVQRSCRPTVKSNSNIAPCAQLPPCVPNGPALWGCLSGIVSTAFWHQRHLRRSLSCSFLSNHTSKTSASFAVPEGSCRGGRLLVFDPLVRESLPPPEIWRGSRVAFLECLPCPSVAPSSQDCSAMGTGAAGVNLEVGIALQAQLPHIRSGVSQG